MRRSLLPSLNSDTETDATSSLQQQMKIKEYEFRNSIALSAIHFNSLKGTYISLINDFFVVLFKQQMLQYKYILGVRDLRNRSHYLICFRRLKLVNRLN